MKPGSQSYHCGAGWILHGSVNCRVVDLPKNAAAKQREYRLWIPGAACTRDYGRSSRDRERIAAWTKRGAGLERNRFRQDCAETGRDLGCLKCRRPLPTTGGCGLDISLFKY